jgi:hypothetical protein
MMAVNGLQKLTELGDNMTPQKRLDQLAAAEGHHSDKGYSLGNQADYEAFAAQRNNLNKMTLQALLPPRLLEWYNTGPVQCAELTEFAHRLLAQQTKAITADGVLVEPGTEVWIFDSVGAVKPTSVRETQALTNYTLFGNIPVANSFSTRKAAINYQKQNAN